MIYIAHRLFALHDRYLAALLAVELENVCSSSEIFLPFCDTNEDTIQVDHKGRFLCEADLERLANTQLLVAILHGPSYDDGVCFEIGYAHALGVPVICLTTDFQWFGFEGAQSEICFQDPLLDVVSDHIHTYRRIPGAKPNASHQEFLELHISGLLTAVRDFATNVVAPYYDNLPSVIQRETDSDAGCQVYIDLVDLQHAPNALRRAISGLPSSVSVAWRQRGTSPALLGDARSDLEYASEASLVIVDGSGAETSSGSALLLGSSRARAIRTCVIFDSRVVSYASGREANIRNLMILYGADKFVRTARELAIELGAVAS